MTVDLKAVQRAQGFGKLLGCRAVDVLDAAASTADRMVVVWRRATEHEAALPVGLCAFGYVALGS